MLKPKNNQIFWETENCERQMEDKHGDVVISTINLSNN